jgi:alpha-L-fucosidase
LIQFGTEAAYGGENYRNLLNGKGEVEWGMLHFGLEDGDSWVPAEVNTSIRPEWFYHPNEDGKVKTVPQLMETYYNSIGRNGTFLLNFPIMPNGLIHENDEKADMIGFFSNCLSRALLLVFKMTYPNYWIITKVI